jgi:adenylate kinase
MQFATKYRTVLIFGAPGTGKGTQGKILNQIPGLVHVACGEVLRSLDLNTKLGKVFLEYSSKGEFVPDDIAIQLWRDYIDNLVRDKQFKPAADYLVLDGIPRNLPQARAMDDYIDVRQIIYLRCHDPEVLVKRIKGRALREHRFDDDDEHVIRRRLEEYEAQTAPTLSYYPPDRIQEIDATNTPVGVLSEITNALRRVLG